MRYNEALPSNEGRFTEVVESFYLETQDGLFFAVKGLEHPPDRLIAILRYAPDPERGDRKKCGKSYRRLYHFAEQEQLLQTAYPQYMAYDPVFHTTLQSVPKAMIWQIYDPCLRLKELMQASNRKGIEEDAATFAALLLRESGIPVSGLGITGSLLIGLQTELSDLDIAVFGAQNCNRVYQALWRLLDTPSGTELRRLDTQGVDDLYAQRAKDTRMGFQDFVSLEKRKANQGSFRGRTYFVRFIKHANETGEVYGDLHYTPLGRATITASIAGDQEAIFTPCRYLLSDTRSLEGSLPPALREIVSFRGRFCEQAHIGESVMATGTLERIQNGQGDVWHRLLLGNFQEDTMVVLK